MSMMQHYRGMLAQKKRIEAFRRAIHAVVRPGDRVLEVGTGLGTFAFFAADAGAGHVWAVDGTPVVHVAKAIGTLNGYAGRIEFLRGWIPNLVVPERCDLLIFEDFAPRLLDAGSFRLLGRLLKDYAVEDVRTVPCRARLMLAPFRSARVRRDVLSFEDVDTEVMYGIDWSPSREYAVNAPLSVDMLPEDLVADPVALGEMPFDRAPDPHALDGTVEWRIEELGSIDGVAMWFDLELAPGEWLSNAPGAEPGSWGNTVLMADPPLAVGAGDVVRATVGYSLSDDGSPGWLAWSLEAGGRTVHGNEFAAAPASLQDIAGMSADAVPRLGRHAALEAEVLALTDGARTMGEIAEQLRGAHPELSRKQAEQEVAAALRGRVESSIPNKV
jgi:hypothetical protein